MTDADRMAAIEARLHAIEEDLEKREGLFARLPLMVKLVERLDSDIGRVSASDPGLGLRIDRLEAEVRGAKMILRWLTGGGATGAAALVYMTYRVLEALKDTGVQ